MNPRSPRASEIDFHQLMLPAHANPQGKIHGGFIMKLVDEVAGICAMRHAHRPAVTVAIDSMTFHSPVEVGNLLLLHAQVEYVGRTSMEIAVTVTAEDPISGRRTHTNSAYVVYVALGDDGKPCAVPSLLLETDADRQRWEAGKARQAARLARSQPPP